MTQEPLQRITVEWGTPLQLSFVGIAGSYRSTLVGMERTQYLICSLPKAPGIVGKLNGRNQTVVRYVHRGVVYGFKSTLLGVVEEPFRLGLLSYPEDIETVRLRQCDRVPCLIPAAAKFRDKSLDGAILDLSVGGCCLAFTASSEDEMIDSNPGEEFEVSVQLPGGASGLVIKMIAGHIRRQGSRVTIGGPFRDLDRDASTALQSYIETMARFAELNEV